MAYLFQSAKQKAKFGDKAKWSVGWYDPDGKKQSKLIGSETAATKFARKIEGQLAAGTYEGTGRQNWSDFRADYEKRIVAQKATGTQADIKTSLDAFKRHCKPGKVSRITTATIDEFVAKRSQDPGKKKGSKASPATVNHDLRHIKAALRVAHDWGCLPKVPKIRMVREPERIPTYVTGEHFADIYKAVGAATMPKGIGNVDPADWWRALLTFAYMTGWRISEVLALRRDDLDLEAGTAVTRHADNKGKRDDIAKLHPVAVDALKQLKHFEPMAFPWYHDRRTLDVQFHKIQRAAGIHLTCHEKHEHTPCCHVYGFHDFRRAFATGNAEAMTGDALQRLMRHKSYATTQRYINLAGQVSKAVEGLHVPDVLRKGATA